MVTDMLHLQRFLELADNDRLAAVEYHCSLDMLFCQSQFTQVFTCFNHCRSLRVCIIMRGRAFKITSIKTGAAFSKSGQHFLHKRKSELFFYQCD